MTKGDRFFKSSLVQSIFYALFAAWILWDKEAPDRAAFEVDDAHQYLPIPFLDALLHDIRHPARMKHLGLEAHLARAIATLNRVDRKPFRSRMTFPTIDGETTIAAITYFYEPFLEARLAPTSFEGGYESWPALDELFPRAFQGVNHNRGYEDGIIDTDSRTLAARLKAYFAAADFAAAARVSPEIATARARYDPSKTWEKLKGAGHFKPTAIAAFLAFPFDQRFIYYVESDKWLNEARAEYAKNLPSNEFLLTVPEPRKISETRPVYTTTLANLHVHERGSVAFPRETRGDDLLSDRDANISEATWRVFKKHFGLTGDRRDEDARDFVGRLFRVAFATLHAPGYQAEHKSALSSDWAHLPIPKDPNLFDRLVAAGQQVISLLDVNSDADDSVAAILGAERARLIGPLTRRDGAQLSPADLKVTVTYWGGGKGRWKPRAFSPEEAPPDSWADRWGERTGDLFINDEACFSDVPEAVWHYQLGGYPVIKKWLGYRQANRRHDNPLTLDESKELRHIIQRIAALLALGPTLDALYQETATNAFTAPELEIAE